MKILRTPDARFDGLPDYPFAPHYSTIRDANGTEMRLHFVDEGPRAAVRGDGEYPARAGGARMERCP